jgi:hypothetical protein
VYENLKGPDEAWQKVTPFVRKNNVPYTIVMGDAGVTAAYDITALPLTLLIDAKGRIAAEYSTGIVDPENVTSNIEALLSERDR